MRNAHPGHHQRQNETADKAGCLHGLLSTTAFWLPSFGRVLKFVPQRWTLRAILNGKKPANEARPWSAREGLGKS